VFLIGSQQTQYVELHKDDLDHVGQLTRSKYEAHGGGDDHLAKVDYSHITPEATMVVEKASGRDSPLRQGARKRSWILPIS
jgi:hypothetical protein